MADPLLELLRRDAALDVGDNQPYAPTDGVYHTPDKHCAARGLPSVLLELRSDQICEARTRGRWAVRLGEALKAIH